jgi:uncharacterized protein (TIGR03118 family)
MLVLKRMASLLSAIVMIVAFGSVGAAHADTMAPNRYQETDLVSDVPGAAMHEDPNLVNAWGLTAGPTSPWWVSDNGTDVSTLYDGTGTAIPLVVKVAGAPTGDVFNGGPGFVVSHEGDSGPSVFLFATESGTIRGWNPAVPATSSTSTRSFRVGGRRGAGAVYKGLAIATGTEGDLLYATDFHNGRVDVWNSNFELVHRHDFVDPTLPDGYAPFGIQAINGHIFVTYAQQVPGSNDEAHGPGLGFVDMFSPEGAFEGRVASRHALNAPWGLAWAPADFGRFSDDLLVGNFGDGRIIAFAPTAGGGFERAGIVRGAGGVPLVIDGLWALEFGNGAAAGPTNSLFFTAGPGDESHGLFGVINAPASG